MKDIDSNIGEDIDAIIEDDQMSHIISLVLDNANDAIEEAKLDENDEFAQGKLSAYEEILDIIRDRLVARNQDLKRFCFTKNLEERLLKTKWKIIADF